MASTIVSVSLPKEQVQFIRKTARAQKITQSSVVNEALHRYRFQQEWAQIRSWGRETALKYGIASYDDLDRILGKR